MLVYLKVTRSFCPCPCTDAREIMCGDINLCDSCNRGFGAVDFYSWLPAPKAQNIVAS